MSILFTLLVYLIIFGVIYWIITILPLPPALRSIAVVVFALLLLLVLVGVVMGHGALPRLNL